MLDRRHLSKTCLGWILQTPQTADIAALAPPPPPTPAARNHPCIRTKSHEAAIPWHPATQLAKKRRTDHFSPVQRRELAGPTATGCWVRARRSRAVLNAGLGIAGLSGNCDDGTADGDKRTANCEERSSSFKEGRSNHDATSNEEEDSGKFEAFCSHLEPPCLVETNVTHQRRGLSASASCVVQVNRSAAESHSLRSCL